MTSRSNKTRHSVRLAIVLSILTLAIYPSGTTVFAQDGNQASTSEAENTDSEAGENEEAEKKAAEEEAAKDKEAEKKPADEAEEAEEAADPVDPDLAGVEALLAKADRTPVEQADLLQRVDDIVMDTSHSGGLDKVSALIEALTADPKTSASAKERLGVLAQAVSLRTTIQALAEATMAEEPDDAAITDLERKVLDESIALLLDEKRDYEEVVNDFVKLEALLDSTRELLSPGSIRSSTMENMIVSLQGRVEQETRRQQTDRVRKLKRPLPAAEAIPVTIQNGSESGRDLRIFIEGKVVDIPAMANRSFRFAGLFIYSDPSQGGNQVYPIEAPGKITLTSARRRQRLAWVLEFEEAEEEADDEGNPDDDTDKDNPDNDSDNADPNDTDSDNTDSDDNSTEDNDSGDADPNDMSSTALRPGASWTGLAFAMMAVGQTDSDDSDADDYSYQTTYDTPPGDLEADQVTEWNVSVENVKGNETVLPVLGRYSALVEGARGTIPPELQGEIEALDIRQVDNFALDTYRLVDLSFKSASKARGRRKREGIARYDHFIKLWRAAQDVVPTLLDKFSKDNPPYMDDETLDEQSIVDIRANIEGNRQDFDRAVSVLQNRYPELVRESKSPGTPISFENTAEVIVSLARQTEELRRSRRQHYTAWYRSKVGDYYYCKYFYTPEGSNEERCAFCLHYASDPGYVYFYHKKSGTFFGRYLINEDPLGSFAWQWLSMDNRKKGACGCFPKGPPNVSFDFPVSLPTVHLSATEKQKMLWPSTIGLPGASQPYQDFTLGYHEILATLEEAAQESLALEQVEVTSDAGADRAVPTEEFRVEGLDLGL